MNFAEKLLIIAENTPKVYDAGRRAGGDYDTAYKEGYDKGYVQGETIGYDKGYTEGQNSVQNPLECVTSLAGAYMSVSFPENYELIMNVPNITNMSSCFQGATGITKMTVKGNTAGNAVNCLGAFRINTLELLDLTEFVTKIGNGSNTFNGAKVLKEIKGTLDLTEATTSSGMFNACNALEETRFKEGTIKLSISFAMSPNLSANSIQSIFDGLATVSTAQTLTLNANQNVLQSQIDSANSKGWTVVGGKVVQEAW